MAKVLSARSDFAETLAVHVALKTALKSKQYDKNAALKKAAEALCKELQSERSIYGRQLKMIALMERGATIAELGKKLGSSRRTLFRYLNHLENAGVSLRLENGKYHIDKNVVRMLRT